MGQVVDGMGGQRSGTAPAATGQRRGRRAAPRDAAPTPPAGATGRRPHPTPKALRDLLEEAGFEIVGESGDGADAVAMARQLEPDIVVIDLRMPVLNGLDATRLIKDARPATQVVVLSAFESPELERQAGEAGAFAFLDKGTMARRIHRVLLSAAVQAVLAARAG